MKHVHLQLQKKDAMKSTISAANHRSVLRGFSLPVHPLLAEPCHSTLRITTPKRRKWFYIDSKNCLRSKNTSYVVSTCNMSIVRFLKMYLVSINKIEEREIIKAKLWNLFHI